MTSRALAVWERREVLGLLVRRDLKVKYEQSILGYAWSLLEPLMYTGIYWFVFSQILHRTGHVNYPLFLISGMLPWLWFNSSVSEATRALTTQSRLITTMSVPREVFPLGIVTGKLVEYLATLPVLALFALITQAAPHATVIGLVLAVVLQAVLLSGLTMILASLNVLLRDVQRVMRVALRALFYLSPVIYPLSRVPESFRLWYELNPLVGIFQLHRAVWFPQDLPPSHVIVMSSVVCVAVFLLGWWAFRLMEPAVLKEL